MNYLNNYQPENAFEKESFLAGSYDIVHSLELFEKDRMISRLERDLSKAHAEITVLKMQKALYKAKEYINIKQKNEEIESLKNQIETLKRVPIQNVEHIVIATQNNTECEYSTSADNRRTVSNSKGQSSALKVDSSKTNVVKKKSTKKHKDIDVSSIAYNLRSRTIVKSNETIGNKCVRLEKS